MTSTFDLLVIGAGSGGVAASRRAAAHGARVGVIESGRVGGTCVNRGCIPKKLFAYAAHYRDDFRDAVGFGWEEASPTFSWADLVGAKNREVWRLGQVYEGLLAQGNVTLVRGRARLIDGNTVDVDGEAMRADHILLAAGARPRVPDIPGADLGVTSDQAFDLDALPQRVVIVGGGYIAVEFASIFRGLGAAVTVVHRAAEPLRAFDSDVRSAVVEELRKKDVSFRAGRTTKRLGHKGAAVLVTLSDNEILQADCVLFATGRVPNSAGLGLDDARVRVNESGAVVVDADSRTTSASIYAIGDLTDRRNLTPVAIAEGLAVADFVFGGGGRRLDYDLVPTAVFCSPPVAAVGLTEAEARRRIGAVDVYKSSFRPLRHTLSGSDERAMVKLVVDAETDRVLGVHMVGPDAPEIVQALAVAVTARVTKAQFDATIALHPSAAEEFVLLRTKAS